MTTCILSIHYTDTFACNAFVGQLELQKSQSLSGDLASFHRVFISVNFSPFFSSKMYTVMGQVFDLSSIGRTPSKIFSHCRM